jgi:beta-N-acetylhexosaminidase
MIDITQMTLEEKIGQLFLLAFSGQRLDEARVLMEEHLVGACYISNDNVPTPEAAIRLTETLQGYAAKTRLKIPLLLGVDQEGAWSVMTPGSAAGPGNMALGATDDPQAAYDMYKVFAEELLAVGLNAVYAPSADCNSNPHNSIIGMRSFGEPPELVAAMTAAAVRGAQENGLIATVKHFPGHGDTREDSHRGIPRVDRNAEELRKIDLYPFAKGIAAGAKMVMTSHILFPAFDAERPATLSPTILQGVLRGEMGFDGVIITDSMNMQAMKKNYAPDRAVIMAINAGVDLVMLAEEHYSHDAAQYLNQQRALITAVIRAAETGELPMARVDDAVTRVLKLKDGLFKGTPQPIETVGGEAHRAVELRVSRQAVAALRHSANALPLAQGQPITVINTTVRSSYAELGATRGIGPNQTTPAFDYFVEAVRAFTSEVEVISAEDFLSGTARPRGDRPIIAVTENYPLPGMDFDQTSQIEIVQQLSSQTGVIVVALRDPYELRHFPQVQTYLCAFSFRPPAAQAAAEGLFGAIPLLGRSPVSVPEAGIQA